MKVSKKVKRRIDDMMFWVKLTKRAGHPEDLVLDWTNAGLCYREVLAQYDREQAALKKMT